jgi:hypothetical protein
MELYGNFGRYGMMFGMAVIGAICAFVDRVAGYRLRSGDWVGFTRFYVFGASIQIGFTLMELTGTAAAALVFGTIITNIFQRYQRFIEHLHHHDGAHPELAAGKLP